MYSWGDLVGGRVEGEVAAIDNVNVRWGLYYQDLVAPLPTVRPTIFSAFIR